MSASQYGLDNLCVIVDRNRIQQGDFTEKTIRLDPLPEKFRSFGFATEEINGHDHAALLQRFQSLPIEPGKPSCLIANTTKAKAYPLLRTNPSGITASQPQSSLQPLHASWRRQSDEHLNPATAAALRLPRCLLDHPRGNGLQRIRVSSPW